MSDLVERLLEPCFERGLDEQWIDAQRKEAADRIAALEAGIIEALRETDDNMRPILRKALHGGDGK